MKYRNDVSYFSFNGKLEPINNFPVDVVRSSGFVYEVIKYINNDFLYFEEHINRMLNSFRIIGNSNVNTTTIESSALKLVEANDIKIGNLKIVVLFEGELQKNYLFFIPHRFPNPSQYNNGVSVNLQFAIREHPNAKIANWEIRDKANRIIDKTDIYETLLVNENNVITEGSRSNVFFVKDGLFYTAPSKCVLAGITRQKVIEQLKTQEIELIYKAVSTADLDKYDHCFITGTSPDVLPINRIESVAYEVNVGLLSMFN
ncbi:MAG: aminotransferase class IV [Bacteroidales bacterium]|nr:aminotransferase class IV [Bacteroidales bacterium]